MDIHNNRIDTTLSMVITADKLPVGRSDKVSDCWQTPQWLFDELNKEFNFDIDLCPTQENNKCRYYCTDYLKGYIKESVYKNCPYGSLIYGLRGILEKRMHGKEPFNIETAFMNPPSSNPKPFMKKAWEDSKYCRIVCLVKCDPSIRWWGTFWEYGEKVRCTTCLQLRSGKYLDSFSDNSHWNNGGAKCGKWSRYYGPKPGCEVRLLPIGIRAPIFPIALLIFDRKGL